MSKKKTGRKRYSEELKREAVQMLLDGYSATSVASNLGISSPSLLHNWRRKYVTESPVWQKNSADLFRQHFTRSIESRNAEN